MADKSAPRAEVLPSRELSGWTVLDREGEKVGTVGDLLVDRRGQVRFLDVDFGLLRGHVLIPVAEAKWGEDSLVLREWTRDRIKTLPPYKSGTPVTHAFLEEIERAHPRIYGEVDEAETVSRREEKVVPLKDAKSFKLGAGNPDPRGWTVFGADDERVGTVSNLLVDPEVMKVRYLEVDVAEDLFLLKDDRRVLVPTEAADLRERGEDVWIRGLTAREIAHLPAYTGGAVDPVVESRVRRAFESHTAQPERESDDREERTVVEEDRTIVEEERR